MNGAIAGAGAGAAASAAIANAIKASGVLVRISVEDFEKLISREKEPLIVFTEGGWFSKKFKYLFSHKGLAFYCKSDYQISLPPGAETIIAKSIWIPN